MGSLSLSTLSLFSRSPPLCRTLSLSRLSLTFSPKITPLHLKTFINTRLLRVLKSGSRGFELGQVYFVRISRIGARARESHSNSFFDLETGIVEALDKLVKEFVIASSEEKKTVYNRMKEEVEKLKGSASRHGKIYLKAARRCMKKGADYATNKILLLEHKLKKSTISAAKADYLTLKKNILSTFAP